MNQDNGGAETAAPTTSPNRPSAPSDASSSRKRASSGTTVTGRLRSASLKLIDSPVPLGMWSATGTTAARAPSLAEIRRGSQGSRGDSSASVPRFNTAPSSPDLESPHAETEQEPARTGSSGKLHTITGEDEDGFPENIFGRGELNDQSYVRGQKAGQTTARVPKLAFRNKIADEPKPEESALEQTLASGNAAEREKETKDSETVREEKKDASTEAFPDLEEDDDLDDLLPKPKKSSKNIDAMLGRAPPSSSSAAGLSVPKSQAKSPAISSDGTNERKNVAADIDDDDDDDLEDLMPKPKRTSKNIDAMLGRTPGKQSGQDEAIEGEPVKPVPDEEGVYPNGYAFPLKKTWAQATAIGFKAFLRFTFTPLGFFIVLYGLNVVAWGGMLFLLLCNASPAMCWLGNGTYDCDNINSPRRIWVEIDSQILNSLFCITGFGLIPWRFRDFYYLLKWRVLKKEQGLRKLAGYHRSWYRLPGSDRLPIESYNQSLSPEDEDNHALPLPLKRTPAPPLTGARASPTKMWKLDFVIWAFVWNTFLQAVLSGFMWGLNRYDRPSWSTGLFVALACVVAGLGGLMQFIEGKRIKKVEGIPLDTDEAPKDVELARNSADAVLEKKGKAMVADSSLTSTSTRT